MSKKSVGKEEVLLVIACLLVGVVSGSQDLLLRSMRDDKIGYYGRCGMPRLATTYHSDTSFNAHLGRSLNGMHKAFVSIGLPINRLFLFPMAPMMQASCAIANKKPQSSD